MPIKQGNKGFSLPWPKAQANVSVSNENSTANHFPYIFFIIDIPTLHFSYSVFILLRLNVSTTTS